MCITFTIRQLSEFSKSVENVLKDQKACKILIEYLNRSVEFKDYLKAAQLWIAVQQINAGESQEDADSIFVRYCEVDGFDEPYDPETEMLVFVQARCARYLRDIHPRFNEYLSKNYKQQCS